MTLTGVGTLSFFHPALNWAGCFLSITIPSYEEAGISHLTLPTPSDSTVCKVESWLSHFTIVASLVDTNILVYRCDPRFPEKRETARTLLRQGLLQEVLRIPHQALVEFVSVVTRVGPDGHSLLPREEA
jgi:hypothetical protein